MATTTFSKPQSTEMSELNGKITPQFTNDIKTDALNVVNCGIFYSSGNSYTGTLPDDTFKYATFFVQKTASGAITVLASSFNSGKTATIAFSNGSWGSWHELAWRSELTSIGTEYKQANADDTRSAGSKQLTVPPGTYLISFGGQSSSPDAVTMQIGNNNYAPWIEDYLGSYIPNNNIGGMNSIYKTIVRTYNTQQTITLYYSAGWYYTEFKAIRLK